MIQCIWEGMRVQNIFNELKENAKTRSLVKLKVQMSKHTTSHFRCSVKDKIYKEGESSGR